jgi:thioredoxin reductase
LRRLSVLVAVLLAASLASTVAQQSAVAEAPAHKIRRLREAERFTVTLADGSSEQARRLLLATGLADQLPPVPGLPERWGRGVFNCPYCDGWEVRERPLAVLAADARNLRLALQLTRYSPDVLLCGNGADELDDDARGLLAANKVQLRAEPIARLEGGDGRPLRIVFADGEPVARAAAFLHAPTRQASDLPSELGCTLGEDGAVLVDDLGQTSVPGVFAAGDLARRPSMPLPGAQVVIAAAEGAVAAVAIDQQLLLQQFTQ